ncbi:MAG: bifunctional adenosylcobinamide kinase/adenosylcobinamide-phosphate guanylyltransferase [Bacillota bacterium]
MSDQNRIAGRDAGGGLILITGGVRSGKTSLAERLAEGAGSKVTYIATMEPLDDEVRERIRAHKAHRPPHWTTVEEPLAVPEAIAAHGSESDAIVVDCLGLWVSNILLRQSDETPYSERCEEIVSKVRVLAETACGTRARVIVVSNEVGAGLVPESLLGRLFRDAMGWSNQVLAAKASRVFLTVAGIPLDIKALASTLGEEAHR